MAITPEQLNAYLSDHSRLVATVKRDYPKLLTGELTDQVAHRMNREYNTDVFGRKARNADGSNPNFDTLTIRLDDQDLSKKKLIDVWGGSKMTPALNAPMWDVRPAHEEPGNGYWRPPVTADRDGEPFPAPIPVPEPPKPEPSADEMEQVWTMLHKLQSGMSDLTEAMIGRCNENADAAQQAMNKAALVEQRVNRLKVKGRTGVRFTHSHDIDLSVSSD